MSSNFSNFAWILRCFKVAYGLKENLQKSKVYRIGVSNGEIARCARILGCDSSQFPFSYLGVPVGENMSRTKHWKPIINRVKNEVVLIESDYPCV